MQAWIFDIFLVFDMHCLRQLWTYKWLQERLATGETPNTLSAKSKLCERILHQCKRLFSLETKNRSSIYMYHMYIICGRVAQPKKYNVIVHFFATRPVESSALNATIVCPFGGDSLHHLRFALGRLRFFCLLLKIGKCLRKKKNSRRESLREFSARIPVHLEGRHAESYDLGWNNHTSWKIQESPFITH